MWTVQVDRSRWTLVNQFESEDGNFATDDCGESCVVMIGGYVGLPLTVQEVRGAMGVSAPRVTYDTDIIKALWTLTSLSAVDALPSAMRNGKTGLYDLFWQKLFWKVPVINCVWYRTMDGVVTVVPHWVVVIGLTDSDVIYADPATGTARTEDYATYWSHVWRSQSGQTLSIVPTAQSL